MPRRVFGCARLTFDVLLLHPLARREVLRVTRSLGALARRLFRLSAAGAGALVPVCATARPGMLSNATASTLRRLRLQEARLGRVAGIARPGGTRHRRERGKGPGSGLRSRSAAAREDRIDGLDPALEHPPHLPDLGVAGGESHAVALELEPQDGVAILRASDPRSPARYARIHSGDGSVSSRTRK